MNKGGKFVFGQSLISEQGIVRLPPQAVDEYHITSEGKAYLFTGSKSTGGFCVTRRGLLLPSELGHIENRSLCRGGFGHRRLSRVKQQEKSRKVAQDAAFFAKEACFFDKLKRAGNYACAFFALVIE